MFQGLEPCFIVGHIWKFIIELWYCSQVQTVEVLQLKICSIGCVDYGVSAPSDFWYEGENSYHKG